MDLVSSAARSHGDAPALMTVTGTLSFGELEHETAQTAHALRTAGICSGSRVALVMPNSCDLVMLLLSLLRTAAIAAPMNNRIPPSTITRNLGNISPDAVIVPAELAEAFPGYRILTAEKLVSTAAASPAAIPQADMKPALTSPATIIHTSSSSGHPKAVLHSVANHYYSALGSNINIPFMPGDRWLLSLPLFHIGGYAVLVRSLAGGGAIVLPALGESIQDTLRRTAPTHLSLVPTQLYRMLSEPGIVHNMQQVKAILLGGSAVEKTLLEKARATRLPVYLSYGSTEMSSQVTTTPAPAEQVAAGKVLAYRELTIDRNGEILVRGRCLSQGYLGPSGIACHTDGDGWFHTGDTGLIDEDGTLHVTGRMDNMFISGGENIHPEEIERELQAIPGILRAVVVPAPDKEYGNRPAAFIEGSPAAPDNDALHRMLSQHLGTLKTPRSITRLTEWQLLEGTEKIDRNYYKQLVSTLMNVQPSV
ncbi:o-succinylbenzoate--CoA ligase [Prosthecochloris vibrioformis]|uniref:O-succinylbenzoate--CoA ligase n=1 Tax=Prosthecochloris vibrioformis TaxID=1098 RepID=A0A5C4S3D5_PROVB|nr:o-succinylbenzoate--CoA ligase [Prosthecochloris vibrioformis]TNJ37924.1 o-succinylbenzoate--CoA ligase [Prosthecochloris vibrioformis]